MNYDNETVREAIKIFPYNERGVFELPDPIGVATVAAILSPADGNPSDYIDDAIELITNTRAALAEIRSYAAGPKMDWLNIPVEDAKSKTGLSLRTLQRYAKTLNFNITDGKMPRKYISEIRRLHREQQLTKGRKGFAASRFKAKKRNVRK